MSIVDEIKQSYRQGGVLTKLIYINIGVFIAIRLLQVFFSFSSGSGSAQYYPLLEWVSVPADLSKLLFKPWTLISYMFVHYDFLHILFNMLYLYWFGRIFLEFLNPRQLLGVYFLGGLLGVVFYLISYNLIPVLHQQVPYAILMGASGSVMAILFAIARYAPNHKIYLLFFGAVQLKYVALVALILDLISIPQLSNTGGHLTHIGGAAFGYFYGGSISQGRDVTMGFNRMMDRLATLFKPKSKLKVTHRRPMSDMEYNSRKVNKQQEVDRILDKIKKSGYDSLSKEEKQTLFDASK
ncbi:rhomboid family intramembrane serine protease [Carboxylicivirga mesophila]|uniref:Rhomboid family intramembrane serine protease n=1 Tax=Carboxylicivirga mesophila TaxID=1166478 RepID=A0ABS5K6G1_9BACT|nr:rhomboid family intramembrane serine protease [Carboxylicivirga mesophila]MBS2210497.1 rhomboid family intramembrane serine protease [Carboxylicivirga mesophila]